MTTSPVRVVTVSATYGAGGTFIAPRLAERLNLPFVDRLVPMARAKGVAPAEGIPDAELGGERRRPLLDGLALLSTAWQIPLLPDPDELPSHVREELEATVANVLDTGGGVILGRGGAMILGRRPGVFHVRLDGPPEERARRGAVWEGIDAEAARARVEENDRARSQAVRRLYGHDPADPSLYHLVLDPTALSIDACVDLLASAAEAFWAWDPGAALS
jgi:cytidylate kinase